MSFLACLLLAAAPADVDADLLRHLRGETQALGERFLDGARTLAQWQERRPRLHREYLAMLGLWPLPERTPLKAGITGTVMRGDVAIEKLHFQSRPGLYVTGNLYRPREVKKKLPAILYVCGHSGRGRDGNKTAFQDHGMWFARNGYVCLVVDTLQLGEVAGVHHGTYNLGRWWWHSLAYTPAGVECFNGIRAIDYLVTRPEVDAGRIGVTGISGGGASTVWIAAADERVKVAVPVSGMSDLESYVGNRVINGHCDCMFLVNFHRWEWTTIAALIAPRPMLFANSDNDRIFPMDGNRRIIDRLRRVYRMHGKPDLVDEHVSKGGHDYRPDLRLAVFKWMNRHLKNDTGPIEDAGDKPLPGKQLRVFPEDADLPRDAINARVDQTFVPRARVELPALGDFAEWKTELLQKLREQSFRAFGPRLPAGAAYRTGSETLKGGLKGCYFYPQWEVTAFLSDPVRQAPRDQPGLLVVLGEEDVGGHEVPAWLGKLAGERQVRLFVPRGTGPMSWTRKDPPNYVERAHALLGQTVDQGRVRDVVAAVRWLERQEGRRWSVAGRGPAGVLAGYAALFEPAITGVVAVDPPASHLQGPHFLGVLRVLDVPEALGLLAPKPLTLAGKVDPAFATTATLYERAGAAGRLVTPLRRERARIDPAGLPGTLVLAGANVREGDLIKGMLDKAEPKTIQLVVGGKGVVASTEARCREVLQAGGVVAAVGPMVARLGEALLPDARLSADLDRAKGRVGYQIGPDAILVVRGRLLRVRGKGTVTIHLAASTTRPARRIVLDAGKVQDLTSLRRAARDRAYGFPPAKVRPPVVERGTLVIVGGGGMPAGLLGKFVALAGGKKAHIVILPTAMPDPLRPDRIAGAFRRAGAAKVTELPGRTLADVESPASLAALKEATGIWFGGGRQWRFVDAYEGTKALPLMFDVLKRGGVIGGSSAGATIQVDYLALGGFFHNFDIMYEGYERGLGFLPGVAIDQHFAQRKRFADMTSLVKTFPQYLGIGIDEATAIVVRGSVAEVVGRGQTHFYDGTKPVEKGKPDHTSLGAGGRYDLKARRVLSDS